MFLRAVFIFLVGNGFVSLSACAKVSAGDTSCLRFGMLCVRFVIGDYFGSANDFGNAGVSSMRFRWQETSSLMETSIAPCVR